MTSTKSNPQIGAFNTSLPSSIPLSVLLGPRGKKPYVWATNPCPGLFRQPTTGEVNENVEAMHRNSCHTCGNMRKKKVLCSECPYIYCGRCAIKLKEQHGPNIFEKGCPVVSYVLIEC